MAVQRILYASDDDPSIIDAAQAIVSNASGASNNKEDIAGRPRKETNKRKSFLNPEVDDAAVAIRSPRQRRNSCGASNTLEMGSGRSADIRSTMEAF